MPTVIAFRDGIEFDRSVGLKQPAELLSWLDGLLRGETALDRLRVEAAQQPTGMMGRMNLACALANAGKLAEATEAYAWLWEHMLEHEPAMFGVRASFMLAEIVDHRSCRRCPTPPPMDDATFEDVRRQVVEQFQNSARQVHRCLVAAGRLEDADKVAAAARELDPSVSLE